MFVNFKPILCSICRCNLMNFSTSLRLSKKTLYEILKVSPSATQREIKSAYFNLSKLHHPDKSGKEDDKDFIEVSNAYKVLSNVAEREIYDRNTRIENNRNRFKTGEYNIFHENIRKSDFHTRQTKQTNSKENSEIDEQFRTSAIDPKIARLLSIIYTAMFIFLASALYIKFSKRSEDESE